MTTQSSSPTPRHIPKSFWVLFLALSTIAPSSATPAQEQRVVTLIPTEIKTEGSNCNPLTISASRDGTPLCIVRLGFKSSSLPTGANVSAAHLLLVGTVKVSQTITAFVDDNQSFGETTLVVREYPPTKRALWSATIEFLKVINAGGAKLENGFSLVLKTQTSGLASAWRSDNSSLRPRLILEYSVPGRAPVLQADGVARHSAKKFLPDPSAVAQYSTVDVTTGNLWSYEPVFFNGLVYLITNDMQLQALSPLRQPVWSVPLPDPGQHLLVSESGRLYIVGNGKIQVYRLDPSNPLTPATEVKTSEGQPLSKQAKDLNPKLAPAVAPDGSLYFVNGVQVYGVNPDLQELWTVTLDATLTSRVTIGSSGQFVYLLARNEGLVAINAQTGETFPNALTNQELLKGGDEPTLHGPVVIRDPDGTEKIYVAANSAQNGILAAFDNFKTVPGKADSGAIAATEKWPSLTGLWSQPIIDQLPPANPADSATANTEKRIYAVNNKTLTAIGWLDGSKTSGGSSTQVGRTPNGGNLAMDFAGNVVEADSRLLFGSDGTLYMADPSNESNRSLRAIVLQYKLDAQRAVNISSPTHLRVDGTVNRNTTLSAGGSVIVDSDFHVTEGSTLTISTGVP